MGQLFKVVQVKVKPVAPAGSQDCWPESASAKRLRVSRRNLFFEHGRLPLFFGKDGHAFV